MNTSQKKQTSLRLTPEAKRLVEALAAHLGVAQSAIWEMAIRQMAHKEKVKRPTPTSSQEKGELL
uniref:Uncharacterized protein n=1 Tax=viral metagenome TaxID=1070528 RepID=A0A6M3KYP8_9ZZZZ